MNKFLAVIASSLCGVPSAFAADIVQPGLTPVLIETPDRDWALQISPYLWAAGMEGSISPFQAGPTIEVEKSFSEVLENLNLGGFVNVWARSGPFVFSSDAMYVNTTESEAFGPLPPLPVPVPPGTVVDGSVDSQQFMATLQAGARVVDTEQFTLDALGGARVWQISSDVTVSALGMSRSYGESFGWIDPVIGARAFFRLTDELSVQAQADIGGFGVGSDLTWSALATVNYTFSNNLSVSAGYKVLDVNYDSDGHVYDTRLSGPVLGLTYRF